MRSPGRATARDALSGWLSAWGLGRRAGRGVGSSPSPAASPAAAAGCGSAAAEPGRQRDSVLTEHSAQSGVWIPTRSVGIHTRRSGVTLSLKSITLSDLHWVGAQCASIRRSVRLRRTAAWPFRRSRSGRSVARRPGLSVCHRSPAMPTDLRRAPGCRASLEALHQQGPCACPVFPTLVFGMDFRRPAAVCAGLWVRVGVEGDAQLLFTVCRSSVIRWGPWRRTTAGPTTAADRGGARVVSVPGSGCLD